MGEYHRIGANKPLGSLANVHPSPQRREDTTGTSRGVKKPPVRSSSSNSSKDPLPTIKKERMATPSRSIEHPIPKREMYTGEIEVILDGGDEENDIDVLKHIRTMREQSDLRSGKSLITTYPRSMMSNEQKLRSITVNSKYIPFVQGRIYTPIQIKNCLAPEVIDLKLVPNYRRDLGLDKFEYPKGPPIVEALVMAGGSREHSGLEIEEVVNWNTSRIGITDLISNYILGIISSNGLVTGITENCKLVDGVLLSDSGTCTSQILASAFSSCLIRARNNQNLVVLVAPIITDISQIQPQLNELKKLGVFVLMPGVFTVGGFDYQKYQSLGTESADIYLPGKNVLSLANTEFYTVFDGDIPAYAQLAGIICLLSQKLMLEVGENGESKYKTRTDRYQEINRLIMEQYSTTTRDGYRIFQIQK